MPTLGHAVTNSFPGPFFTHLYLLQAHTYPYIGRCVRKFYKIFNILHTQEDVGGINVW